MEEKSTHLKAMTICMRRSRSPWCPRRRLNLSSVARGHARGDTASSCREKRLVKSLPSWYMSVLGNVNASRDATAAGRRFELLSASTHASGRGDYADGSWDWILIHTARNVLPLQSRIFCLSTGVRQADVQVGDGVCFTSPSGCLHLNWVERLLTAWWSSFLRGCMVLIRVMGG